VPLFRLTFFALDWGELREGLHIAGYTFERACRRLEFLLEGDRWKVGGRFNDVNEFLDSLRLDTLKASAEARRRIANRIKELQPKVSNRQIAKTLGVGKSTVYRDVPDGTNAALSSSMFGMARCGARATARRFGFLIFFDGLISASPFKP
jgi:hypothetical protein